MPRYEFECTQCGHQFETHQKVTDPNPMCPGEVFDAAPNQEWIGIMREARDNFAQGRKTPYPAAPTWIEVGPNFDHTVIRMQDGPLGASDTRSMAEWVKTLRPCQGETQKLISRGSFLLKGGGWAADGY